MAMGISRNGPCVCGSGKRFKGCCGKIDAPHWNKAAIGRLPGSILDPELRHLVADEPVCEWSGQSLPPGILVQELDESYRWRDIAGPLISTSHAQSAVVSGASGRERFHPQRVTTIVDQGAYRAAIQALVRTAYQREAEPFFGCRLRWFESPQILRYSAGGYYRPHCDSEGWNREIESWEVAMDRHLSLLIYLDDGYQGGELVFPNFDFRITPKAGMLVAFPSDHRYLHGATPVLSGVRHAVVSWSVLRGRHLVFSTPPADAISMNESKVPQTQTC